MTARPHPLTADLRRLLSQVRQNPVSRRMVRDSNRIGRWLQRAGVPSSSIRTLVAVDLTEFLIGADDIKRHVRALLTQDPGTRRGARAAATHATSIEVALDHLLDHARRLNRNWQRAVEDVLYARPGKRR